MSNTFFRAHYLGIGTKINFTFTLKDKICSFDNCELTFSNDLDPSLVYIVNWNKKELNINEKFRVLVIKNEFGQLCLMEISQNNFKEDFTHLSFCNKILPISEEEWNKLKQEQILRL